MLTAIEMLVLFTTISFVFTYAREYNFKVEWSMRCEVRSAANEVKTECNFTCFAKWRERKTHIFDPFKRGENFIVSLHINEYKETKKRWFGNLWFFVYCLPKVYDTIESSIEYTIYILHRTIQYCNSSTKQKKFDAVYQIYTAWNLSFARIGFA